jgi:8-oxo-dGTP diphosphatase
VLIAQRPPGRHHAGLWEFPGGKIEPGEQPMAALRRELAEELDIEAIAAVRVMTAIESRVDFDLHLHAWRVREFRGIPRAIEASALRWIAPRHLPMGEMPPADLPIVRCLQLPPHYAITPDLAAMAAPDAIALIKSRAGRGANLIRLRCTDPDFRLDGGFLRECEQMLAQMGVRGVVDLADHPACRLDATGVHLRTRDLMGLNRRPLAADRLILASCHLPEELAAAERLDVDAVLISPVFATASHPGHAALGWPGFARLHQHTRLPTYALGGMKTEHLQIARSHGAVGIAGISGFADWT